MVETEIEIESRLQCTEIYDGRIIQAFIYLSMYLSIPADLGLNVNTLF